MAYKTSSSGTGTADGSGNMSLTLPASIAANDILIIGFGIDNGSPGAVTWPSGFTLLSTVGSIGSPDGESGAYAWKRAAGTEGGTGVTIRAAAASSAVYCTGCVTFDGRDTGTNPAAASVATNTSSNASGSSITSNGVTASSGDDLTWWSMPDIVGPTHQTHTWVHAAPTNYTLRLNVSNGFARLGVATRDNVSAGATGSISGTFTDTTDGGGVFGWIAHLARIPAAATTATGEWDNTIFRPRLWTY